MTDTAITPSSVSVSIVNGQPVTTSTDVAEHFGKTHKSVLRAIRNLDCSPEFNERNFALIQIDVDLGKGRTRKDPAYQITRDGFVFLCMGFTGKEAAKWKEAYINAFNQMEAELVKKADKLPETKTRKALPNGLTCEQQDAVKALVKSRAEALPQDKRAKAAITMWSSVKSKFGASYKEVPAEHFTEVLSLIARLPLEGEYIPAGQKVIRSRDDLSFTYRDDMGRLVNWAPPVRPDYYEPAVEMGVGYFQEVAELSSRNEEEAYNAIRFALSGSSTEWTLQPHGSSMWKNAGWGVECGFAESLAAAALTGLRAIREGAEPYDPKAPKAKRIQKKPKPKKALSSDAQVPLGLATQQSYLVYAI